MNEKVVVLYGGPGGEAEVSKSTASSVQKALSELNVTYESLEFNSPTWVEDVIALKPTFVFIAMHGSPGEDGTVQAVLESLNIAYNGSDVHASSLAMNKSFAKKMFKDSGLDVAQEFLFDASTIPENVNDLQVQLPAVFKPNTGGSSVGIEIVYSANEWPAAFERLKELAGQETILQEEYIAGRELTVPVMNDRALGVMEITTGGHEFYDYTAKYSQGGSQHIFPAPIATEVYKDVQEFAVKAHKSLGCTGVTRVDFRYDEEKKRLVVLEVNTLPGMTSTSLVPEVAQHEDISFPELIDWIIKDGKCQTQAKSLKDQLVSQKS